MTQKRKGVSGLLLPLQHIKNRALTPVSEEEQRRLAELPRKSVGWLWLFSWGLFRDSLQRSVGRNTWGLSAALTYNCLVSLVPLFAIAFILFDTFGGVDKYLSQNLLPLLQGHFGAEIGQQIYQFVDSFQSKLGALSQTLGAVSAATFFLSIILLMNSISNSLDIILGVPKAKSVIAKLVSFWVILTLTPMVIALSSPRSYDVLAWLQGTNALANPAMLTYFLKSVMALIFTAITFFFIYLVLPTRKPKVAAVAIGAVVATLVFQVLQFTNASFAGFMFKDAQKQALYGTVPLLAVLILYWLRFVWFVVLVGASVVASAEKLLRGNHVRNKSNRSLFNRTQSVTRLFSLIAKVYREDGLGLQESELRRIMKDTSELELNLEYLLEHNAINAVGDTNLPGHTTYIPSYRGLQYYEDPYSFAEQVLGFNLSSVKIAHREGSSFTETIQELLPIQKPAE